MLKSRIESNKNFDYDIFVEILKKQLPLYFFFLKKQIYNIFFLDLICTYRGFRHCKGLPVRGQRTWTNSNSCYKSNTILRQHRIFFFKKLSGLNSTYSASQIHLAEQINLLWKIQWDLEWKEVRKKQKKILQENKQSNISVDLKSMSDADVSGFSRRGSSAKKKMFKQKKNVFTLGFEVGFSQNLSIENSVTVLKNN